MWKGLTVRALGHFWGQDTRAVATEQSRGISVLGVAQIGRVVVGCEDGVKVTLLQSSLGSGLLNGSSSARNISLFNTTSPELAGAVREVGALDGSEEVTALGDLLGQVMAGVGNGGGGKEG